MGNNIGLYYKLSSSAAERWRGGGNPPLLVKVRQGTVLRLHNTASKVKAQIQTTDFPITVTGYQLWVPTK